MKFYNREQELALLTKADKLKRKIMQITQRYTTIAFALLFLVGCQPQMPQDPNLGIKSITLLSATSSQKRIRINQNVSGIKNQGVGIFNHNNTYTILAGEYRLFGKGNNGLYYEHIGKGLRIKSLGITEHRRGGIFIPNNRSNPWYAWSTPNRVVYMGGVIITTGVTDADIIHRVEVTPVMIQDI